MLDGDAIEKEIQRTYQAYQREPNNPAHSLKIGQLYEQRKEYANALPWLESAFRAADEADPTLELRIINLRLKVFAEEIDAGRRELDAETDPKSRRQLKAIISAKLDELNELLRLKKEIERRSGPLK